MSSEVSVRARGLQKQYSLFETGLGTLAGMMSGRKARRHNWALRDFDLDASAGDFIGVVGRNGAGKSTLLQIIAGISAPDSGELTVNGRVTALLELGAGFNPDFTGLENVKLSAALYGLTASQIDQRIDAISTYAGLDEFMHRPTREYSSGMLARLAFSVCMHVDAEIVIVDELFGVGDFRFRQSATRRLLEFSKHGIVFFVSHNEATVLSLCNRAIFLEGGRKMKDGSTKSVFRAYQRTLSKLSGESETFRERGESGQSEVSKVDENPPPSNNPNMVTLSKADFYDRAIPVCQLEENLIASVALISPQEGDRLSFEGGERLLLAIQTREIDLSNVFIAIMLKNSIGQTICARDTLDHLGNGLEKAKLQVFGSEFDFRLPLLPSGDYAFDVAIGRQDDTDWLEIREAAAKFSISSRHVSEGLANITMDEVTISPVDMP